MVEIENYKPDQPVLASNMMKALFKNLTYLLSGSGLIEQSLEAYLGLPKVSYTHYPVQAS